jgi:stringent starvation protein B
MNLSKDSVIFSSREGGMFKSLMVSRTIALYAASNSISMAFQLL